MKEINILGELADSYKSKWMLDVKTPSEALRAINANRPGFLSDADKMNYVAILVDEQNPDNSRQVTDENGTECWGNETLYLVPKIEGEIGAAIVGAVAGAAFAATTAGIIIAAVINIVIAIAISMIAQLIAGTPDGFGAHETEAPENKPSYILNGVVNTAKQGHRIPVLYGGPLLVGSMMLSSRIITEDLPV